MSPPPEKTALILYFSCSRNTARLAEEAQTAIQALGWQAVVSPLRDSEQTGLLDTADLILLGTPTQYFTVPESALRLIGDLPRLNGTPAFVFSTFGGCVANNVPFTLATELTRKGANVMGGAHFLTPHSCRVNGEESLGQVDTAFGKGRPNADDLQNLRDVLGRIIRKIEDGKTAAIDLERLKINNMGIMATVMDTFSTLKLKRMFMPRVRIESGLCSGCRKCSAVCDSGSIEFDETDTVRINQSTCTKCYACIEKCPEGALTTNWKQAEILVRTMNGIAGEAETVFVL